MSLLRKWGFGAELSFEGRRAVRDMGVAQAAATRLRASFEGIRSGAGSIRSGMTGIGLALAPVAAGFGLLTTKASSLAADLEAQSLTMRTLIGDATKADKLLSMIRENAAATPFQEGDLIEGSKRLLRLTGQNIDANMDLLKTVETMAALNPTKSVTDAVEAILDATSGGGFERMKEFGIAMRAEDFKAAGRPGGEAWAGAVVDGLKKGLQKQTRGADLVGELAKTFKGRKSTMIDAFENLLKPIGKEINKALAEPMRVVTDRLKLLTKQFEALPKSTKERIGQIAVALSVAAGAVGGLALGLVALAGLAKIAAGTITVLGGMIGVIANPPVVAVVLLVAGAIAALVGAVGLFLALGKRELLPLLTKIGGIWDRWSTGILPVLTGAWEGLQAAFYGALGPLVAIWESLRTPTEEFLRQLGLIADEIGTIPVSGAQAREAMFWIGKTIADRVVPQLQRAAWWIGLALKVMTKIAELAVVLARDFRRLGTAIFGVADGSLSVREGIRLASIESEKAILRLAQVASNTVLGTFSRILRAMATRVEGIPGLGGFADTLRSGALSLDGERGGFDATIEQRIADLDKTAARLEKQRAEAMKVDVKVNPEVTVSPTVKVEVDGQEIARSVGDQAVRDGERGKGPPLPGEQRTRVLRGSGLVSALRPAEVF